MAELVAEAEFHGSSSGVTTTDDSNATLSGNLGACFADSLGAVSEVGKLSATSWTVPDDGVTAQNGVLEEFPGLGSAVHRLEAVRNAGLDGGVTKVAVILEVVSADEVDGEDDLNIVLLGLFHDLRNDLSTGLIIDAVTELVHLA